MHGICEYILFVAVLDHAAEIHYADFVAYVFYDGQIVRNENIRYTVVFLQGFKQIYYLRLNRYVERRNGFVADDEFRFERKGAGDTYSLSLTARKLVRVSFVIMRL